MGVARILILVIVLASCGRGEDRPVPVAADAPLGSGVTFPPPAFLQAAADSVLAIEMREFRFELSQTRITGPKVYVVVSNLGRLGHELRLSRADYPGYGSERRVAQLPPLQRSGHAELGVELAPGRYLIRCDLPFGRTSHGELGMAEEIVVVEGL